MYRPGKLEILLHTKITVRAKGLENMYMSKYWGLKIYSFNV